MSNGLLDDPKHVKQIGHALFFYLQLVRRVTKDVDGWGLVYGGRPVTDDELSEFGLPVRSIKRYRRDLVGHGYISAVRAPHGCIYKVHNSKKFNPNGNREKEK